MASKNTPRKTTSADSFRPNYDIFSSGVEWEGDERLISIDERSAILRYAIKPNKNFASTYQATDVKLEIDRRTIAEQMTIGEPGREGVGRTETTSWHVIDLPGGPRTLLNTSEAQTFRIEVKTGIFAALELNPKAQVSKATIDETEFSHSQKQTVNLRMRVSCRYQRILPPVPQSVQDLEILSFRLED